MNHTITETQREAGRSAEPVLTPGDGAHISMPVRSRFDDNLSDARMLAEDACDLVRHPRAVLSDQSIQLAQAKALASIALYLSNKGLAS